jgi:hypothetical protein
MILRRVREHVSRHNWFAVTIDFVIVVIGVFVGIQASNWNQGRLERQQAREYRAMLADDLDANLENLAGRRALLRMGEKGGAGDSCRPRQAGEQSRRAVPRPRLPGDPDPALGAEAQHL